MRQRLRYLRTHLARRRARQAGRHAAAAAAARSSGGLLGGPGGAALPRVALPLRRCRQTVMPGSPFDFLLKVNIFGFLLVSGTDPNVGLHKSEVA